MYRMEMAPPIEKPTSAAAFRIWRLTEIGTWNINIYSVFAGKTTWKSHDFLLAGAVAALPVIE
jgi:hypothetical protein